MAANEAKAMPPFPIGRERVFGRVAAAWKVEDMRELISRIASETGLSPETVRLAVGHMLLFIKTEGTDPCVDAVLERIPGANETIVRAGTASVESGENLFSGVGIMALGSKLTTLGLDMSAISVLTRDLLNFARQHAGSDAVARVVATTPGLAQFA